MVDYTFIDRKLAIWAAELLKYQRYVASVGNDVHKVIPIQAKVRRLMELYDGLIAFHPKPTQLQLIWAINTTTINGKLVYVQQRRIRNPEDTVSS